MVKKTPDGRLPLERWPDWKRKIPYGKIGFGYIVDPEDPYHIIPNEEEIAVLEVAFDYIEAGSSWREVCEWISQKLLKSMVHQTVANLYKKHRNPFRNYPAKIRKNKPRSKESIAKQAATQRVTRAIKARKELEGKLTKEDFPNPELIPEKKKNPGGFKDPNEVIGRKPPVPQEINFVFKPNPGPQLDFLSSSEEEVLYGGAAGGEPKSWFSASFHSNVSK